LSAAHPKDGFGIGLYSANLVNTFVLSLRA
jgi:hypothetical protein